MSPDFEDGAAGRAPSAGSGTSGQRRHAVAAACWAWAFGWFVPTAAMGLAEAQPGVPASSGLAVIAPVLLGIVCGRLHDGAAGACFVRVLGGVLLMAAAGAGWAGAVEASLVLQLLVLSAALGALSAGPRSWCASGRAVLISAAAAAAGALTAMLAASALGAAGLAPAAVAAGSIVFAALAVVRTPDASWRSSLRDQRRNLATISASAAIACAALLLAPEPLSRGTGVLGSMVFAGALAGALVMSAAGAAWRAAALAAAGCAAAAVAASPPPVADTQILLGRSGGSAVVYDRASQSMRLTMDGEVVDAAGPDDVGAPFAATVLRLLASPGDRVLLLGPGAGRLPPMLLAAGAHEVEVVDAHAGGAGLRRLSSNDGPVPPPPAGRAPADVRISERVGAWGRALAALPPGARQAIVIGELPVASCAPQATAAMQAELRRVVGDGLVVQVLSLEHGQPLLLRRLLAAAALAHPWNGVFAVGDAALLLSAAAAPRWPEQGTLSGWSDDARWIAHAAHVGSVADVQRTLLGTVIQEDDGPQVLVRERGRRAALDVLRQMLRPTGLDASPDPDSVLLGWQARMADLRAAAAEIGRLSPAATAQAQIIASRFLHVGAPMACLQAALGSPAEDGVTLVGAAEASRRAHALDPTFFHRAPQVLQGLPRPLAAAGELEDLAVLPDSARLAVLAAADTPLGVALRARFPSRCARALVEQLAQTPLPRAGTEALRQLADPFVLQEAGRVLRARGALGELLSLWRGDLAMPAALAELRHGTTDERRRLAAAVGGRRDRRAYAALADLLVDPDLATRCAAGDALRASLGELVPYDPRAEPSALNAAADRLRSLHNRTP